MSVKWNALVAALMVFIVAPAAHAAPIVINGDFSQGNTGFTSGYGYVAPSASALWPEGLYTVASNPNAVHPLWINLPNYSGGNMLIVNGATASTPVVWQEDGLNTVKGVTYDFSAQAANICCITGFGGENDPSHIYFQYSNDGVNFTTFTDLLTHPPGTDFATATGSFTAAGAVSLRIIDQLNGQSGNDFAIDNISLTADPAIHTLDTPTVPEPASWALMMVGVGGVGGALRARRRLALL